MLRFVGFLVGFLVGAADLTLGFLVGVSVGDGEGRRVLFVGKAVGSAVLTFICLLGAKDGATRREVGFALGRRKGLAMGLEEVVTGLEV